ncbi:thiol reductant ABC exporter subunit CydD [Oceanobacillus alkalisoli]|uniref:thiol reductant ABC exporter subunit CydD n=1 Tax=Oceanobacillus alkalisoli TaxID=2925113 RepID=UPI001EF0860D|nr:thiol reductant ABC exporter subunit CydD [Oceanobacillus alkalisoli]MCF3941969.1 thiol reductant ABC exporter subunit CydD [Oceanobacillus alkalisoli]MCG5102078.1 thiol reductant ABC exporter subunit CydD [Oceanobacillus alkalisoli]
MHSWKELAQEHKGKLILMVIFSLLSGSSIIAQAYLLVYIVNEAFLQGTAFADLLPYLALLLAALLGRTLFNYGNGKIGVRLAALVKSGLRSQLLRKYSKTNMQTAMYGRSGEKVSVIMDTVDEIDDYYSSYIPQVIQSLIIPIMLLITIFTEHFTTGIIIVITAPFIPIFMVIIGFSTKDKSEEQLDKMAAFSGKFLDTLQGLTTLKLYGRSKKQKAEIEESSLNFRDATMVVLKTAFANSFALEFISMLSMGLIALEVAIRLIIFQNITFFTGFLMLILAPEFYNKLKELGNAFHTGRGSSGAFNKLQKELDLPDLPVEWGSYPLEARKPPAIALHDASFYYEEEGFRLDHISVDISPYEQVAIIGKTGSGKSTLLHVIAGLVANTGGEILVNGRVRSEYDESSWFNELSYISQHPYLFSGTVAENIAIGGRTGATREEIEAAGEKAGIAELIASLEKGYDTPIGEAGRGLSGGEKQRVALARAFLKQPSIILFDEPTVGLDLRTERILQQSIKELAKHATIITVAHRLHTIKHADKIILLDSGRVVTVGTHEALLKTNSDYRSMVSAEQGGEQR